MRYIIPIVLFLTLSCSVEKRLQRLCEKYPDKCRQDTVRIPSVQIVFDTLLRIDTANASELAHEQTRSVDSILSAHNIDIGQFRRPLKSALQQLLNQKGKTLIAWPKDTIRGQDKDLSFSLWIRDGHLHWMVTREEIVAAREVPKESPKKWYHGIGAGAWIAMSFIAVAIISFILGLTKRRR